MTLADDIGRRSPVRDDAVAPSVWLDAVMPESRSGASQPRRVISEPRLVLLALLAGAIGVLSIVAIADTDDVWIVLVTVVAIALVAAVIAIDLWRVLGASEAETDGDDG